MRTAAVVAMGVFVAACAAATAQAPDSISPPAAPPPGMFTAGYLPKGGMPGSLEINPPPPAEGSATLARDKAGARDAVKLHGSPRYAQATIDADLFTAKATDAFSCAAGFPIGPATTPRLEALLRKTAPDFGYSVYPTKQRYMRKRPFQVNGWPMCTEDMRAMLEKDGSYPSGHSAIGYGWGLVLAELVPDRAARLVARGMAFGDSRRVCNVHWLSDIEAGRDVAAAAFARLHAEPAFAADLAAAREELARVKAGLPAPDCAREDAALGRVAS